MAKPIVDAAMIMYRTNVAATVVVISIAPPLIDNGVMLSALKNCPPHPTRIKAGGTRTSHGCFHTSATLNTCIMPISIAENRNNANPVVKPYIMRNEMRKTNAMMPSITKGRVAQSKTFFAAFVADGMVVFTKE